MRDDGSFTFVGQGLCFRDSLINLLILAANTSWYILFASPGYQKICLALPRHLHPKYTHLFLIHFSFNQQHTWSEALKASTPSTLEQLSTLFLLTLSLPDSTQLLLLQWTCLVRHGAASKSHPLWLQLDRNNHRLVNLPGSHAKHSSAMLFSKWHNSERLWILQSRKLDISLLQVDRIMR